MQHYHHSYSNQYRLIIPNNTYSLLINASRILVCQRCTRDWAAVFLIATVICPDRAHLSPFFRSPRRIFMRQLVETRQKFKIVPSESMLVCLRKWAVLLWRSQHTNIENRNWHDWHMIFPQAFILLLFHLSIVINHVTCILMKF